MLATLVACAVLAPQQHVRFVATGDDRWDVRSPRAGQDENGVNVRAMRALVAAMLKEKPQVLLFNGDTIGGGSDEQQASQYKTFMATVKPMYDAGVKMLVVRGNHEMRAAHADDLWRATFTGRYANPDNGPEKEKAFTFSYKLGNVLFLGLDQFMTKQAEVNQKWLDKTLADNPSTHVFAFAHKMAFTIGSHTDGMNVAPAKRDAFLASIAQRGETTFFCGHDHLYDHTVATKGSLKVHQLVCGTAGAPSYHAWVKDEAEGGWSLQHLTHIEQKIGYAVVDIDGPKVTVVFKAESAAQPGVFLEADRFSYTVGM